MTAPRDELASRLSDSALTAMSFPLHSARAFTLDSAFDFSDAEMGEASWMEDSVADTTLPTTDAISEIWLRIDGMDSSARIEATNDCIEWTRASVWSSR